MRKSIYTGFVSLCSLLILGVFNTVAADYSVPVSHTHNGREHKHQLPEIGVAHRHGIGQAGEKIRSQNKVIYSNTTTIPSRSTTYKPPTSPYQNNTPVVNNDPTLHRHGGREHRHALPNQGVYHRHGNGATGQRIVNNGSSNYSNNNSSNSTVIYGNIESVPTYNDSRSRDNISIKKTIKNASVYNNNSTRDDSHSENRRWREARGFDKFVKGSTHCRPGSKDCNVCAVNVQQQFQKAATKQINWSRKRWNFTWPQPYPPHNVRPLDVFDGDPKYALGIPDEHVQGFVRTNSRLFPYAGSHSHKRNGGVFFIERGANGEQTLSSLHKTSGKHPSGVQVIGKYVIYGEGNRLFFRDVNSQNQTSGFRLNAPGANFGGGLGIIKLARDHHLLITTGPGGQKRGKRFNRFYHLKSINGRPSSIRFINESSTKKPRQWSKKFNYSENMSLITECGTGDIYSIHTTGDGVAITGNGYWRLSKLVSNGKALGLTAMNAFTTGQNAKRCSVRATGTVSVNPQNRLEFLCHGYAKDPDGSGFNVLGKSSRSRDKFYYNVGVVR